MDCIDFYVKRYENDKDYFASFIAGKLYFIKKDYENALQCFYNFCNDINENTISTFKHIDNREVTLNWETLKGIKADNLFTIANMCQNSLGTLKDIDEAIDCYTQSGNLGNIDAFVEIGKIYKSDYDVKRCYNKSFAYYKKAVDLGKDAIKDLIDTFLEGYGIEIDIKSLIEYAKKARIREDKIYKKFGDLYRDGQGVEQNIEKAIEYYQKGKISESIYYKEIGDLYNEGKYIKKDIVKAFQYYVKANYREEIDRRWELIKLGNECLSNNRDNKFDIDKFVKYYREAGVADIDIFNMMIYFMKQNYFSVKNLRYTKLWHCEYEKVSSWSERRLFIVDKFTSNEIEQFIKHSRKFGMADSMIYKLIGNLFCRARYEFDAYDWNTNNYNKPAIIELVKYYYKKANIDEFLAYYVVEAGNDYIESEVGEKMLTLLQRQAENGDGDI